jgi:two-component system chemotaxis sensor kinase CheA
MRKRYRYFIIEGAELVDALTKDLLELEKRRDDAALIDRILRHAHKLKGAAGVVRLTAIGTLAHRMEDRLARVKERKARVSPRQITRLLGEATEIGKMIEALKEQRPAAPVRDRATGAKPEPRGEEPAWGGKAPPTAAAPETIRILDADLDRLSRLTNEIHIQHGRLKSAAAALAAAVREKGRTYHGTAKNQRRQHAGSQAGAPIARKTDLLEQQIHSAAELSREMTDVIKKMRLTPVGNIAHLFEKAVRDLGVETGKKIDFTMTDRALYLDRALLDRVTEPLFHLLRNSVIHGIEPAVERQRMGKMPGGSIKLTFAKDRGSVRISCDDDGRGLDAQMIRDKAIDKKVIDAHAAAAMTDDEALHLILRSGLSLATGLTQLAGRGVGLDVVKDCVNSLGGVLEIASAKGRFTRFTMTLPLSVDTIPVFGVRSARQRLLIPLQNMLATQLVAPAQIAHAAGKPVIEFNDAPIALIPLADLLESETPSPPSKWRRAVIVKANIDIAALWVDALEGRKEVIPQPLQGRLAKIAHLQAAAILADGDPAFVLDVPGILEKIKALPLQKAARMRDRPGHAVMVVDDSLTSRRLIEGMLSAEGYRVVAAGSGDQSLELMETDDVDLFVVDIEMPGLDGFELSQRIRGSRRYRATPIIILSTRGSDADKQKGMAVGANAYIVKGTFDQEEFLATVGSLIS